MPKFLEANSLTLDFLSEAHDWESQALPIGNGRLGAMILGGMSRARYQFNVDSLWTGRKGSWGDDAKETDFGAYQAMGDLFVELEGLEGSSDYERQLDLGSAVHSTTFLGKDGTRYLVRAFSSNPAQVVAIQFRASGKSQLRGKIELLGAHGEATCGEGATLRFDGEFENGLNYEARVEARAEGGSVRLDGSVLVFEECDEVTIHLAAATDYAMDSARGYRAGGLSPAPADSLSRVVSRSFEDLLSKHEEDHGALFSRVSVDFGRTNHELRKLPLDERIRKYRPGTDPELVAQLFQYGRYLLIASSRKGTLPANLQGIWNDKNSPPWNCDYHTNINIQMNYWHAESTNLAECHEQLFDLLEAIKPECREATQEQFGVDVPGFTYRTSHNIFGGQEWKWNLTANAWYAMHYVEHFAYGRNRDFLEKRAWPYLREASEFWLARLVETKEGKLVAPAGWSPEHGPVEDGVSYDQQLIYELFDGALRAAGELELKSDIVDQIQSAKERLLGPQIGRFGQLQEWVEDRDDPEDRHRHTSHLIGVYPGTQISRTRTPAWADAAKVSLKARGDTGDSRRSWTWPWRCALWSRLGGDECHRMIDELFAHNMLDNLITTHPPLQMDGNFGMTAAIAEMLLQSHAGEISLLPGVDLKVWPDGNFSGLKARGGIEVAVTWAGGRLTSAFIKTKYAALVTLRSPHPAVSIKVEGEGSPEIDTQGDGSQRFQAAAGACHELRF